jgi:hypothetical protein
MRAIKALFLLVVLISSDPTFADITVIHYKASPLDGDDRGYVPNQRLAEDHVFNIATCAVLVVLHKGEFINLHGEFKGTLDSYVPDYKSTPSPNQFNSYSDWLKAQPPDPCRPKLIPGARDRASGERASIYKHYFRQFCEPGGVCTENCKQVWREIKQRDEIDGLKLACP